MARKTGSVNHTHKYFRRPDGLWACAGKDDCTHFMPRNMSPAPAGRMSDCWGSGCKKKIQLAPYNMEDDYPMCDACMENKRKLDEVLEEMGAFDKPTGLAAYGARTNPIEKINTMENFTPKKQVEEKDEIEVIEPDEEHASDCDVYITGECTCK